MEEKKIELKKILDESDNYSHYHIDIKCDADCEDYMYADFDIYEDEIDDLTLLMLTYFSSCNAPESWEISSDVFGGCHIIDNNRFNNEDEDNWLLSFAVNNEWLPYTKITQDYCHSISEIKVTYFDDNGNKYICELPDLGELFNSEQEFIDYVKDLY